MTNHKRFSEYLEEITKNYPLYESVNLLLSYWEEGKKGKWGLGYRLLQGVNSNLVNRGFCPITIQN